MTNPFEDPTATYLVLTNQTHQHSLWPATLPAPAGWAATLPGSSRQECLAFIDAHGRNSGAVSAA
ncbi:MbtH family protein [Kitasatospora aureofaciens]|uniref:MbtH family protein n=1 Tax=Kitasatospora aureofaciens TaxID=1894 RepID=UPI001C437A87|nr:MbtH family protein [Kitasatospora aureofaciens]MBV6702745.1 MbtH family protein [Kitasatospora aureofaciens]